MSFKHEKKRNATELSKYLWELKEKEEEFAVSWKIPSQKKERIQISASNVIYA